MVLITKILLWGPVVLKKYISHKLCHRRCWRAELLLGRLTLEETRPTCYLLSNQEGWRTRLTYSALRVWILLCGMSLTLGYESHSGAWTLALGVWTLALGVWTRTVSVTRASQQDSAPYACSRLQQLSESVTPRKSTLKIWSPTDTIKNAENNWKRNHLARTSRKPFCPSEGGALLY